ncbi:MAG: preprotein translocase subunit SecG [Acidobacteriota bacterium]
MFEILLYAFHIIVSLFLILVVLLQQGKSADLSVFGGGGTMTTFGARGAASLFHKLTVGAFVAFIVTTIAIGVVASKKELSTVISDDGSVVEESTAGEGAAGDGAAGDPATGDDAAGDGAAGDPAASDEATTDDATAEGTATEGDDGTADDTAADDAGSAEAPATGDDTAGDDASDGGDTAEGGSR